MIQLRLRKLRTMTLSAFSAVKSQALPKRRPSLQENLLSYESRNYNFTTLSRLTSAEQFGNSMAMNCLRRAFDLDEVAALRDSIIAITEFGMAKWYAKRTPSQIKALDRDLERPLSLEDEITKFKLMVKRDAKVKLDSSCLVKHPPAQNIMFHRKAINAIFSPCFDEFKNRVLSTVSPNVKFFTEMTNETFARMAKKMLGTVNLYHVGEVDFSKFDKSQDAFIKAFERRLYTEFGFDAELLDVWMEGEYRSDATTLDGQLSFTVENQRKSGASNTWIGNSLVTLGVLSMYYDVSKFRALFISGDDSLIFSDSKIHDFSTDINADLGFETKFMSPSVPYFCSKFLVFTGNNVFFVPDPYKMLVKLGATHDKYTDDELFEVYTSFRDLTKDFGDERTLEVLSDLVHAKYNFVSGYTLPALCAVHCIRSNFSSFSKLYPEYTGWRIVYSSLKHILRKFVGHKVDRIKGILDKEYFFVTKSS